MSLRLRGTRRRERSKLHARQWTKLEASWRPSGHDAELTLATQDQQPAAFSGAADPGAEACEGANCAPTARGFDHGRKGTANADVGRQATHPSHRRIPRSTRSEEHTSELQSRGHLVCRLLLEKKKK